MAKVKVWNDNDHEFKADFRDEKIVIPPHSWILMDDDAAVLFRGDFHPMLKRPDGTPDPRGFKMIRIEPLHGSKQKEESKLAIAPDPRVCMVCRFKAANEKELESHMKEEHSDQLLVDPEAEEEIKRKRGRPSNASKDLRPE